MSFYSFNLLLSHNSLNICPLYHYTNISKINKHTPFFDYCHFTMFSTKFILSLICCLICNMDAYSCMLISISMLVLLTETIGRVRTECASDGDIWITNARSHSIAMCTITLYLSFVFVLFTIKLKGCLSYSYNHINLYSQLTLLNLTTLSLILKYW